MAGCSVMKMMFGLVPLALGLAACQTYPGQSGRYGGPYGPQGSYQPYPGPGGAMPYRGGMPVMDGYRAMGTEPGWTLDVTPTELRFTGNYGSLQIVQPRPQPIAGVAGEIFRTPRLEVNIVHGRCGDGMSDRTYPDSVQVYADGKLFRGCGAPSMPGYPSGSVRGPGAMSSLSNTNWRVLSINQRTVPMRGFYMNFMPDRLGAKFGCNAIGSGYTSNGGSLTAGAIVSTKMACPNSDFEAQGIAVLSQPMRVNWLNPQRISLSNNGGTIELVKAR